MADVGSLIVRDASICRCSLRFHVTITLNIIREQPVEIRVTGMDKFGGVELEVDLQLALPTLYENWLMHFSAAK